MHNSVISFISSRSVSGLEFIALNAFLSAQKITARNVRVPRWETPASEDGGVTEKSSSEPGALTPGNSLQRQSFCQGGISSLGAAGNRQRQRQRW